MARLSSPKHNGSSAGRTIAVLVISATALLTGTVFGYAAASVDEAGSIAASVYGPSHLKAPLTDASERVASGNAAVSPSAAPDQMAPLMVSMEPASTNAGIAAPSMPAATNSMAPLTASSLKGPLTASSLKGPLQ